MIGKIAAALKELGNLKSLLPTKIQENKEYIEQLKDRLNNIDDKLFVPTGLDDMTPEQLLLMLEESYPGFSDKEGDIFSPTTSDNINIKSGVYTDEEILAVLTEWQNDVTTTERNIDVEINEEILKDCDIPKQPVYIPYTQMDIIEALRCEDVDSKRDIIIKDTVHDANIAPDKLFNDDVSINTDYSLDDLELLSNVLDEPSDIIIVSTIDATVRNVNCEVGQHVNCDTILFNTNKGSIKAGVQNGTITAINVSVGDNIFNKELIEIKSHNKSITSKVISSTIKQGNKINRLIELKEQEPEIEKNYFIAKIQEAFYEGRYDAYSMYYNSFNPLVELRDKRNKELQLYYSELEKAENAIKDYFKDGNIQYKSGDGKIIMKSEAIESEVTQLINNRNKYFKLVQSTVNDINESTAKINQIRSGINFFATSSDEVLAEIKSGHDVIDIDSIMVNKDGSHEAGGRYYFKNPILNNTVVTPFSPSTKLIGIPAPYVLAKSLQGQIDHFTNELGVHKLTFDKITDKTVKTYEPNFKMLEVKESDTGDKAIRWTKAKIKGSRNSKGLLSGKYHELKVDFFNFVYYSNDKDKSTNWWVSEVKSKEQQLRTDLDAALTDVISRVYKIGQQYGEVSIGNNKVFIENRGSNALNIFKHDLDKARDNVKLTKSRLDELRKVSDEITQDTNNIGQEINGISSDDCTYYSSFSTITRNGKKYKLYGWPSNTLEYKDEASLSKVDINYRGNPIDPDISPGITDIEWWRKFCQLASVVNLVPTYWPVGLLLPTPVSLIKIPLPITWLPIKVIPTPTALIVVGIAQAGVLPCPFVTVLNLSDKPLGPIPGDSIYLAGAVRPFKKIKKSPGSAILPIAPIVNIGGNTIDAAPHITQQIPLIKDDLPPWERLSLDNPLLLLFLSDWCKAGKKGEGFFENP